jgi:hypothetical protein
MPLVTDSNRSVSFFFGLGVGSIDVCVERNAMQWNGELGMIIRWSSVRLGGKFCLHNEIERERNMAVAISNLRRLRCGCGVRIE